MIKFLVSAILAGALVVISGCGGSSAVNDAIKNGLYGNNELNVDIQDNLTTIHIVKISSEYKAITKIAYVTLNLIHDRLGDLEIELISPSGTKVALSKNRGGNKGVDGITFKDDASNSILHYVGSSTDYKPEEALTAFVGEDPNGYWLIKIKDSVSNSKTGKLRGYTLFINGTK